MKAAVLNKGSPGKRILWLALFVLILLASSPAFAATYYIAPNGNNGGAGTSAAPWKTFAFAIPKLNPGDTLILQDGTYTRGTTGLPNVNCSAGAKNGTAGAPITIQAENERKAWLKGDGGEVLGIRNCSSWSVVGVRASNADVPGPVTSLIFAGNSNNINFRRNLISNSNRRVNQAMITYNTCKGGLVEENEMYDYLRHGLLLAHTENVIVRRNYANSRDYPTLGSIPGVYSPDSGGDSLVAIYPGANNIVENNISERNMSAYSVQASGSGGYASVNNRFYANISLSDGIGGGLRIRTRQNNLAGMTQNTYIENQVVIGATGPGGEFLANKNTVVTNTSIFDGKVAGYNGNAREHLLGDGQMSASFKNSLAINNKAAGFVNSVYPVFNITSSNSFGNSPNYSPASLANGNMSVNPGLGSCKVFIPDNSPMKGKGAGGDDIGANVLCRYENGTLTDKQLWNWSTGQFPCGVVIAGVNDKAGASCFDVNKRLNVNANGCTLPATPSCKQPAPPTDLPPAGDGTTTPPGTNPCPPAQTGAGTTAPPPTPGSGPAATATGPGKTYYVSTTGSDSNNGTSEATAFKTIQKGANVAKAGDTVMVLPGTYFESGAGNNKLGAIVSKNDGTASARIRFVSKERWGAKITTRLTGAPAEAIWRSMGDYVDIEGFEIDGTGAKASPGIFVQGAYSRVLHNHVHDMSVARCGGGVGINSGEYEKNIGTEITGNLIHDNWRPHVAGCPGTSAISGYGIYFASPRGKVQNNIIYKNGSVGIHLWHAPTEAVVSHNLVFNNGGTGIVFGCGDKPHIQCKNITVSNNIFMNHDIFAIREYGNNAAGTNRVVNNIIFGGGKIEMRNGVASGNMLNTDPKLTNFQPNGGGNYMPATGSPAIDAASATCTVGTCIPPNDYLQGARPFGASADIGPFEVGSTPGTVPPGMGPSPGGTPGTPGTGCATCTPGSEPDIDIIIHDVVCAPAGANVPVGIDVVDSLTGQPAPLCRDVYVGPIPYGFTLSAGTIYESRTGGIVYKLTPAELLSLTITPPPGYSGALVLHVSYTPPPL